VGVDDDDDEGVTRQRMMMMGDDRDDDRDDAARTLTEAEHEVYDRQIRVWGVETQSKLSRARVLVVFGRIGHDDERLTTSAAAFAAARGLGAETLKNIALAGCGKIVVRDDGGKGREGGCGGLASERRGKDGNFLNAAGEDDEDDSSETVAEAMARTLREMNPFGDVSAAESSNGSVCEESAEYYSRFDVVVACGYTFAQCEAMGAKCREVGCGFFGAFHGAAACYFFADLGEAHEYVPVGVSSKDGKGGGGGGAPSVARFASLTDVFERCGADWGKATRRTPRTPLAATLVRAFEREHGRIPEEADAEAFVALSKTFAERHGAKPDCVSEDALRVVLAPSFESPAINAIVGGVLAQEVLKAVTRKGAPCGNFFIFDAVSGQGVCHNLGDAGDERR
jgi:ubiquitin-like 1-activating enzyme E1 A